MTSIDKALVTAKEYLELPETSQIVELIEGEIIESPAVDRHQEVSGSTYLVLTRLVPGGTIRYAPVAVYFDDINFFEPDLFWVSSENTQCILVEGKYWRGGPDLVIEILSPSTARRDKKTKSNKYAESGVREYWLIDPDADYIEVFELQHGAFVSVGIYGPDETFHSSVLGKEVPVGEILARK